MKKLGIGFGVLIVVVIAAILIVPGFLDWNEYKGQIERTASYYSGRTVTIKGDISLSLLPTSALSARDVTVANLPDGRAEHMLSLKSLDIRVSFPSVIASLFGGRIKVEKLILVDPVIALEVLKDGRKNWDLIRASGSGGQTSSSADISLDKFQIVNGQISFENMATGRKELLGEINANVKAKSTMGPFVVAGTAKYRGIAATMSLELGRNRPGKKIPLTVKMAVMNGRIKAAAIGGVILRGENSAFSGKLNVTAADVGNFFGLINRLAGRKSPGKIRFGQDFALDSRIEVRKNNATARNLTIRMGQSRGQGRVEISRGNKINLLADLTINKLDLDKLLAALAGPARGIFRSVDHMAGVGLNGNRLKKNWLNRLSGRVGVKIGAVRYNGKIASRIAVKLVAKDGVFDRTTLQARMPGGASVLFTGQTTGAMGDQPVLTGNIVLNASNLRGLLGWLKLDVRSVPAGQLTQLSYKSALKLTPDMVQLYGASGRLDAMSFTGGVSYALKGRPSYGISLDIRNLNLDFYRKPESADKKQKPVQKSDFSQKLAVLDKFDARYKIALSNFTLDGIRLRTGKFEGLLLGGKLVARTIRLTDIAGLNLVASGQGKNFASKPEITVKLSASAKSLAGLRRTLEVEKIFDPVKLEALNPGRMELHGSVAATFGKMVVDINSRIGASRFAVKGIFRTSASENPLDIDRATLDVDISSPGLGTLINQFGLPLARPGVRDDHPLQIKGQVRVAPGLVAVDGKVNIAAGVISVKGQREARGKLEMTVDLQGPQTREFIRGLGIDFQPALRKLGPIALKFSLAGDHDQYVVSNIIGIVGPVKLGGSGKINLKPSRPYFEFKLQAGDIPLHDFLKNNTVKISHKPIGKYGQWNRQAMDLSLLSAYNGRVEISADSLRYNRYVFEKPKFDAVLKAGVLTINNFTGRLFGGAAALSANLDTSRGDGAKMAVTITLKKASLSEATKSLVGGAPISGFFDLTGKFTGTGMSQYDIISSLSGTGKLVTGPGMITGIDLPALSKNLAKMTSNNAFANLLTTALSGGKTSYNGSVSNIVAKDGGINFSPFDVALDGARSTVRMTLDLPNWTIHSEGSLVLVDHPDAPPIGVLVTGNISTPDVRYSTGRLKKYVGAKVAAYMLQKLVGGKGSLEGMFGNGAPQKKGVSAPVSPKKPTADPAVIRPGKPPAHSKQPPANAPKSGEEFGKRLLQKLFSKDKKRAKGSTPGPGL